MNEIGGSSHSVLLPPARVTVFAQDKALRDAAQTLAADWRFARVVIDVVDGTVDDAIVLYARTASPDIVMVETGDIGAGFTAKLETLGGHCAEGTSAVVVGPVNDVYLYRTLIDLGVSDYLVKPLDPPVMAGVFSKILLTKLGATDSRLVACIGAKGGVGTSTVAQLVAMGSANHFHQKTILMDAAGGWSYLSVAMGGESVTTWHEVARASQSTDKDSFNRMMVAVHDKLSYLATGAESLLDDGIHAERYEEVLNRIMQIYPVTVVDLSRAPIDITRMVLSRAHDVVIISTPTIPSLRTARALMAEVKTLRGGTDKGMHSLINRHGEHPSSEVSENDIVTATHKKPSLMIPYSPKIIMSAEGQGIPLEKAAGGQDILNAMHGFMQSALGFQGEGKSSSVLPSSADGHGLLGHFLGKMKLK